MISGFIDQALIEHQAGRLDAAEKIYRHILSIDPHNFAAKCRLGTLLCQRGDVGPGSDIINGALEAAPEIDKRFHDEAHNNLGYFFFLHGDLEKAAFHYNKIANDDASYQTSIINTMFLGCCMSEMKEWAQHCNKALSYPFLCGDAQHSALILRATAEWATGDYKSCEETLNLADKVVVVGGSEAFNNDRIYCNFLRKLLEYRKNNPAIYSGTGNKIFMVGDSHVLSYSGTTVDISHSKHTISPHLIVGAKAWHLSQANKYSTALDYCIARIPERSPLILSFGEIDCREDEGIIPYWKQNDSDLAEIVSKQVKRYVSTVSTKAEKKSLRLLFLAVPAPLKKGSDQEKVVTLFNAALKKEALEAGHRFIDVYGPSREKNLLVDDCHLKAEALQMAAIEGV